MGIPAQTPQAFLTSSADAMADLSVGEFVRRWRLLTGEPPAILLSSRSAMLHLLVESMPVKPLWPAVPSWDDRRSVMKAVISGRVTAEQGRAASA